MSVMGDLSDDMSFGTSRSDSQFSSSTPASNYLSGANTSSYSLGSFSLGDMSALSAAYLNYQNQVDALNWAKEMTYKQWERDDNAVQRRVADLEAAGLSKVLAAGSSAGNTPAMKANAPQLDLSAYLQTKQMQNQFATSAAQRSLMNAQARKANAEADYVAQSSTSYTQALTYLASLNAEYKEAEKAHDYPTMQKVASEKEKVDKEIEVMNYNLGKSEDAGVRTTDKLNTESILWSNLFGARSNTWGRQLYDVFRYTNPQYLTKHFVK